MRSYLTALLGNSDARVRLGRAIESDTLSHALLIAGPKGSGKHTMALSVAAALNCEHKSDGHTPLPCGACNSCRRIKDGSFTDIKTLSKKKDKATVGVGEIRDFREDMFLSATESAHKIYIIESAECLTKEAQNALLTVLEEPPVGVVIILLATECDRLLTTVRSRVQLISTERFDEAELEGHLLRKCRDAADIKAKSPDAFKGIIKSADGILGEAIRLSDRARAEENASDRAEILEAMTALVARSSYAELHRALSAFPTKRQELIAHLEKIISALSDLIKVKTAGSPHLTFYSSIDEARRVGGAVTLARLTKIYDAVILAHGYLSQNAGVASVIASLTQSIL